MLMANSPDLAHCLGHRPIKRPKDGLKGAIEMSTTAQSALKSISKRARFLLDEYDSHLLTEFETELVKIGDQLAIVAAKLSGDYVEKGKGRPSSAGMLVWIRTLGGS